MPYSSTFAQCAGFKRMARSTRRSSSGFGGRPPLFFGSSMRRSIGDVCVTQKVLAVWWFTYYSNHIDKRNRSNDMDASIAFLNIQANEAGYEHAMEHGKREENPYKEGSDEWRAWDAGFEQGVDNLRDVRAFGI